MIPSAEVVPSRSEQFLEHLRNNPPSGYMCDDNFVHVMRQAGEFLEDFSVDEPMCQSEFEFSDFEPAAYGFRAPGEAPMEHRDGGLHGLSISGNTVSCDETAPEQMEHRHHNNVFDIEREIVRGLGDSRDETTCTAYRPRRNPDSIGSVNSPMVQLNLLPEVIARAEHDINVFGADASEVGTSSMVLEESTAGNSGGGGLAVSTPIAHKYNTRTNGRRNVQTGTGGGGALPPLKVDRPVVRKSKSKESEQEQEQEQAEIEVPQLTSLLVRESIDMDEALGDYDNRIHQNKRDLRITRQVINKNFRLVTEFNNAVSGALRSTAAKLRGGVKPGSRTVDTHIAMRYGTDFARLSKTETDVSKLLAQQEAEKKRREDRRIHREQVEAQMKLKEANIRSAELRLVETESRRRATWEETITNRIQAQESEIAGVNAQVALLRGEIINMGTRLDEAMDEFKVATTNILEHRRQYSDFYWKGFMPLLAKVEGGEHIRCILLAAAAGQRMNYVPEQTDVERQMEEIIQNQLLDIQGEQQQEDMATDEPPPDVGREEEVRDEQEVEDEQVVGRNGTDEQTLIPAREPVVSIGGSCDTFGNEDDQSVAPPPVPRQRLGAIRRSVEAAEDKPDAEVSKTSLVQSIAPHAFCFGKPKSVVSGVVKPVYSAPSVTPKLHRIGHIDIDHGTISGCLITTGTAFGLANTRDVAIQNSVVTDIAQLADMAAHTADLHEMQSLLETYFPFRPAIRARSRENATNTPCLKTMDTDKLTFAHSREFIFNIEERESILDSDPAVIFRLPSGTRYVYCNKDTQAEALHTADIAGELETLTQFRTDHETEQKQAQANALPMVVHKRNHCFSEVVNKNKLQLLDIICQKLCSRYHFDWWAQRIYKFLDLRIEYHAIVAIPNISNELSQDITKLLLFNPNITQVEIKRRKAALISAVAGNQQAFEERQKQLQDELRLLEASQVSGSTDVFTSARTSLSDVDQCTQNGAAPHVVASGPTDTAPDAAGPRAPNQQQRQSVSVQRQNNSLDIQAAGYGDSMAGRGYRGSQPIPYRGRGFVRGGSRGRGWQNNSNYRGNSVPARGRSPAPQQMGSGTIT